MRRRTLKTIALLAMTATLAAGCGSEEEGDPIPADLRAELDKQLVEAQDRLGNGSVGACEDIQSDTEPEVTRLLDTVPDGVDPDVRNALNEGFARLFELVSERCDEIEAEQQDTETQTTEEPPAPDTNTEPQTDTETETTPTEETTPPEETTPEQPTVPDTGNGDDGTGDGGGGGDDGGVQVPRGDEDGAATPPGDG